MGCAINDSGELTIITDSKNFDYNLTFNREHFEKIRRYFPKGLEVVLR